MSPLTFLARQLTVTIGVESLQQFLPHLWRGTSVPAFPLPASLRSRLPPAFPLPALLLPRSMGLVRLFALCGVQFAIAIFIEASKDLLAAWATRSFPLFPWPTLGSFATLSLTLGPSLLRGCPFGFVQSTIPVEVESLYNFLFGRPTTSILALFATLGPSGAGHPEQKNQACGQCKSHSRASES